MLGIILEVIVSFLCWCDDLWDYYSFDPNPCCIGGCGKIFLWRIIVLLHYLCCEIVPHILCPDTIRASCDDCWMVLSIVVECDVVVGFRCLEFLG